MSTPTLPDDLAALRALAADLAQKVSEKEAVIAKNEAEITRQKAHINVLQEKLNLLLHKRFGTSSEKGLGGGSLPLFNEAEQTLDQSPVALQETEEGASIEVPAHSRKRGGRRPLPEGLPRVEVVHDLPEHEKACACGRCRPLIGQEVSEQLDIIPAQVQVLRHVRLKYGPCDCGQSSIQTAPLPPQPIAKSIASPGLLAHLCVAKYADALPLYRQESILARAGIELPRATTAHWMIRLGTLVRPLLNLIEDHLLGYDVLAMDETTLQVLKEAGRTPQSLSYLWVRRGGPPDHPAVLFDYDPSRSQAVPKRLLAGYQGYLQTDGYAGYDAITAEPGIVGVGCIAHARRGFADAYKAGGKKAKSGKAHEALELFKRLYAVETYADKQKLTPEERHTLRQTRAKPVLEQMRRWLDATRPQVPPETLLGKALTYLHNQWDRLLRYLDDGRLPIDNNRTENAIRPFVIGRRNWLFADTPSGASASAALYSLIETAKLNGHEPYTYLRHIFKELPSANSVEDFESLLPFRIDPRTLRAS